MTQTQTQTLTQSELLLQRAQWASQHGTVSSDATVAASGPQPHFVGDKLSTHVRIDGHWIDLTHWKPTHPGGTLILEQMNGLDATDAFYSLHSEEAIARLSRFPRSKVVPAHLAHCEPAAPSQAAVNFRAFRAKLQADGWWNRSLFWEAFYTGSVYVLGAVGSYVTWTCPSFLAQVFAVICIGLAMQQAGWIGHDYIHARGKMAYWNAVVMQWCNGFSRGWWSSKHNTHHVFTNHVGLDADIENDPVFHLFFPDPKDDTIFRKMQHWYFVPVASTLYISWRVQSIQYALKHMIWKELAAMVVNYLWMYLLGWKVALASIYLGGFLVSFIVTATHQSEEMLDLSAGSGTQYSFCEGQFATTRDARTSDPFTEWLWGGMQYQLEHHLFPTMPKYRYAALAPLVQSFAEANGLQYRVDHTQSEIFARNYNTLKFFAQDKAPLAKQE